MYMYTHSLSLSHIHIIQRTRERGRQTDRQTDTHIHTYLMHLPFTASGVVVAFKRGVRQQRCQARIEGLALPRPVYLYMHMKA